MRLSIVVPAHNEEDNITDIVTRIEATLDMPHELIIVNDHSTDSTGGLLTELSRRFKNMRAIENHFEKGFANALKAGFGSAAGEVIVPVMGDSCDDLSSVGPMLEKIGRGYDIVCGSRYIKGGGRLGGSRLKGFLSCAAGRTIRVLLGIPTSDITNAFKAYRKEVLDLITIQSQGFEISMEIPLKAYFLGFKMTEVPTVWKEREKGKSSFRVFQLLPRYIRLYLWAIARKMRG
jgi:dolichol-phosphate mannosyltransferase